MPCPREGNVRFHQRVAGASNYGSDHTRAAYIEAFAHPGKANNSPATCRRLASQSWLVEARKDGNDNVDSGDGDNENWKAVRMENDWWVAVIDSEADYGGWWQYRTQSDKASTLQ